MNRGDIKLILDRLIAVNTDEGETIDAAVNLIEQMANRIDQLEAAAKNLVSVKGRYNTEQAYKRLEEVLK